MERSFEVKWLVFVDGYYEAVIFVFAIIPVVKPENVNRKKERIHKKKRFLTKKIISGKELIFESERVSEKERFLGSKQLLSKERFQERDLVLEKEQIIKRISEKERFQESEQLLSKERFYKRDLVLGKEQIIKPNNKTHCNRTSHRRLEHLKFKSDSERGIAMSNDSREEIWTAYNLLLDLAGSDNTSGLYLNGSNMTLGNESDSQMYCGEWEAAQHNLFQFSNLCFGSAFLAPRTYKPSVLLLRALLSLGFFISAGWAGVHVCLFDAFLWNMVLGFLNAFHTVLLICRFCPPALSLELTELYVRIFKPLKVSKKHFKELTREVTFHQLNEQETYAIEECTAADERLSILLKGRMRVTCGGTHLHFVNCYQFVDSPEWEANNQTNAQLFQVTIVAEEECSYLCWSRPKLDRVLRHRPQLRTVFSHIIGKDITQKLYCLNEQVGQRYQNDAQSRAAKEDLWRNLNRSVSVDAVNTGTHGHVRSTAWHKAHQTDQRKLSMFSDYAVQSPDFGQKKCWIPVVASQFPATSPFTAFQQNLEHQDNEPIFYDQDEAISERSPLISTSIPGTPRTSIAVPTSAATMISATITPPSSAGFGKVSIPVVPVTLIPVIVPVPVIAAAAPLASQIPSAAVPSEAVASSSRSSMKKQREVKFDETKL